MCGWIVSLRRIRIQRGIQHMCGLRNDHGWDAMLRQEPDCGCGMAVPRGAVGLGEGTSSAVRVSGRRRGISVISTRFSIHLSLPDLVHDALDAATSQRISICLLLRIRTSRVRQTRMRVRSASLLYRIMRSTADSAYGPFWITALLLRPRAYHNTGDIIILAAYSQR
jgi:hypothetical protein